jgi:integrase
MPYKLKRRGSVVWRGQVKHQGQSMTREFPTRNQALSWEVETKKHLDQPVAETGTPSVSLIDWCNEYLAYAMRFVPKTFSEKRTVFRRLFKALDHRAPAESLTPHQALEYLQAQHHARSGYAANKDRKNLGAAWAWGTKYLGLPTANPFLQVERFPEDRVKRYVPPVADFEKVLDLATGQDKVLLTAMLYLAARRGELYRLTWDDVDFAGSTVRLGTRKRQDGSMEYAEVPMAEDLYDELLAHRQTSRSPHVFVQESGRFAGKPFQENRGFPQDLCEAAGVRPFGCHAIRHLTASLLAKRNVPMTVIQAVLRHKKLATTERYIRGLTPVRPHLDILLGHTKRHTKKNPEGISLRVVASK